MLFRSVSISGEEAYVITLRDSSLETNQGAKVFKINLSNPTPVAELIANTNGIQVVTSGGIAVTATDLYLPATEGIIRVSKSGGYTMHVTHPFEPQEGPVWGTAHDGVSLYFITLSGHLFKVD